MHWHVLFEDNHLIAVFKPAGMLTQPDPGGDPDLFSLVREDLAIRHQKKRRGLYGGGASNRPTGFGAGAFCQDIQGT